ncbi:MAG TPA: two-component regulator propeller domain-containing protein, partial [Chitinophagaceae bacterium]|nr:two-component regulator propeller domain-containing protein [Chitinophagaceae bacterium]
MQKILALYMLWVSSFSGVRAQDSGEPGFIHYTRQQGLSNNFVSGIVQDSAGYIWIATHRGLNRFDGTSFKTILYTGSPGALPDNAIYSLQSLPGQQLGVATSDGAQIISTRTLAARTLDIPTEDALRYWSNSAKFIQRDADGNYGVSTNTGFYIFSPEGQLIKRLDGYSVKDIGHAWMLFGRQLYLLPNGNMLQESRDGLFQYNRRSHTMEDAAALYPGLQQVCPFIENT